MKDQTDLQQKTEYFKLRTGYHLYLVHKWSNRMLPMLPASVDRLLFEKERDEHDMLKWVQPEYCPYVELTWNYRCKRLGIENPLTSKMQNEIHEATLHHIRNHKHHPEYWAPEVHLNKEDRDRPPSTMIDGTNMPLTYVATMVADWFAMSEELGTHPGDWADKNVNIRWKFTDEQRSLIYSLIDGIWSAYV